jgi:RecA/RadA recombinase
VLSGALDDVVAIDTVAAHAEGEIEGEMGDLCRPQARLMSDAPEALQHAQPHGRSALYEPAAREIGVMIGNRRRRPAAVRCFFIGAARHPAHRTL